MDLEGLKRPTLEQQVNIRIRPAELEEVRAFAERQKCTVSDVFRFGAKVVIKEAAAGQATAPAEL